MYKFAPNGYVYCTMYTKKFSEISLLENLVLFLCYDYLLSLSKPFLRRCIVVVMLPVYFYTFLFLFPNYV